ncbi:MAG: glycosyltransferase family 4 protein [Armatimonadetes bacterium]|nr:glycosyltransferase family 4 protein [Armatimonadota bacterium]
MSPSRPLRMAFGPVSGQWTGGIEYLRLVRRAMQFLPAEERPVTGVLAWSATEAEKVAGDLADEAILVPESSAGIPTGRRVLNRLHRSLRLPVPTLSATEAALQRFGADVLFGTQVFSDVRRVPLLGWIPDFQYAHVPEAYDRVGVETCANSAQAIAERAVRIVLSSQTVRKDLEGLLPQQAHKARVARFVSPVPEGIYDRDPAWVCNEYHLPERFLYIPNQFWAHKNHHLVLEALRLDPARSAGVVVVCTGNPHDGRNPTFFGELLVGISQAGLRDRMIVLGYVPRANVVPLMRQSVALLQPSRFEGWNVGIEEAKSLGKAVLASDLAVHLEQDPPGGVYFSVNDAEELSNKMAQVWDERKPGPDLALEAQARAQLTERTLAFARAFVGAAREAARGQA